MGLISNRRRPASAPRTASLVRMIVVGTDWRMLLIVFGSAALLALATQQPFHYRFQAGVEWGSVSDLPFMQGFYPPESASQDNTWRWSPESAQISVPGVGQRPLTVDLAIVSHQGIWQPQSAPVTMTIDAGAGSIVIPLRPTPAHYRLYVPASALRDGALHLWLHSKPWSNPGDPRSPTPGIWYNLYVVLDIFSRKIVGWLIAEREDAALAEVMIAQCYTREGVQPDQLTLHADRGAPMTSKTIAELLIDLGVAQSHSRATISDDNPYSEAQFKTMKYGPTYPERVVDIDGSRVWMRGFAGWYTTEHMHSGIAFLPLEVVDSGRGPEVIAARQAVLDGAFAAHPERFPRGRARAPQLPTQVGINLPKPSPASACSIIRGSRTTASKIVYTPVYPNAAERRTY